MEHKFLTGKNRSRLVYTETKSYKCENLKQQKRRKTDRDFLLQVFVKTKAKGRFKTFASYRGKESFNKRVNFYFTVIDQILA